MGSMRKKTPTPVTMASSASALAAKSAPSLREKPETEPIRRTVRKPLTAKQKLEKRMLTAAWNGDIQKVWDLLDEGANVNAMNEFGETALHLASHGGHSETVELLLAKKANINTVDNEGNTALMLACIFKNINVIPVLLEKGADVGISNKNGWVIERLINIARKNVDVKKVLDRGVNVRGVRTRFIATPVPDNNSKNNKRNGGLAGKANP